VPVASVHSKPDDDHESAAFQPSADVLSKAPRSETDPQGPQQHLSGPAGS
jgi:hypothetical protein